MSLRVLFSVLILFVLSLSCALPVEDLLDTAYDESESLPFDIPANNASVSIAATRQDAPFPSVSREYPLARQCHMVPRFIVLVLPRRC